MLAYDLCSGAGGATLGLERAGFDTVEVIGWERDPHAVDTARTNGHAVERADIFTVDWSGWDSPTVLFAGVPCQPFSLAGHKLGIADLRDAFPAAIRAVRALTPKVVIFENVRNIMSAPNAGYRAAIIDAIRLLGYEPTETVIDCADYGTAGRLLAPTPGASRNRRNARTTYKMRNDGVTITEHEAQLLQGYPDDYVFRGPARARIRQIGNSFPPQPAEALAHAVIRSLAPAPSLVGGTP